MRVGRESPVRPQFPAEVFQLLCGKAPFEKRARVDTGRGMALEINRITLELLRPSPEEMVEADFEERGGRSIRGNMAANTVVESIRANHHGQGVPADQAFDPALNLLVAGEHSLFLHGDGVYVRSIRGERRRGAQPLRAGAEAVEQNRRRFVALFFQDRIERFNPFLYFLGVDAHNASYRTVIHQCLSPPSAIEVQTSRARPTT